jgi:hypothetical protein
MKLFKFVEYIKEAFGRGALSEEEFSEVESIILELEDRFDLIRTYDKENIEFNEYFLGHISNVVTDGNFDVSLAINLYPRRSGVLSVMRASNKRIDEIYNFIEEEIQPRFKSLGYVTKIKLLEKKIDSWTFVPTGIRLDIKLD